MVADSSYGYPALPMAGWSVTQQSHRSRDGSLCWQVNATWRGHTIMAWGRTRDDAWRAACRQANRVRKVEPSAIPQVDKGALVDEYTAIVR